MRDEDNEDCQEEVGGDDGDFHNNDDKNKLYCRLLENNAKAYKPYLNAQWAHGIKYVNID